MSPQTPAKPEPQSQGQIGLLASYSGPLPPAEELERYNNIHNGAAKLLFDKFSEEQSHRQEIEKNESNANIKALDRHYDITDKVKKRSFIGNIVGQILSAAICLSALALCGYLAMHNHTWEAVAVVAIPFAGIIRAMKNGK